MNLKRDFLSVLSDSTLTFVERSVKLYPFLVFLSRAIRSDKLDDYIKLKQKGIVIAGHQLHFSYVRTVDVQLYIRQAYQCHFCEAIVLLHKPYYVRRGQSNTCMCKACENVKYLLISVMNNSKLLVKPVRVVAALRLVRRVLISWMCVSRMRLRALSTILVRFQHWKPLDLELYTRAQDIYKSKPWIFARLMFWFNYLMGSRYTIVKLCKGGSKSEMIDRLLCNGSIPSHGCMSYGKPRCYGEGNIKELCCTCLEYDSCIKNEIQGAHWTSKSVTILMCIVQYLDERVWCDEISELVAGDEVSFQQDGSLQIY